MILAAHHDAAFHCLRWISRPRIRSLQLSLEARGAVVMQTVNRGNPHLQLLLRPTTSDPYAQNSLLETRVALNGARR
jgi:hypothetical protein